MPDRDNVSGRGIAAGLEARGGLAAARPGSLDGLTGLPNRAAFAAILDGIFADPDRSGVALLRITIDEVGKLREDHGPSAADQLVAAVAGRLKRSVRDGDVSAKLKEAEFGLILAADDVAEAACAAQRVLDRLREPYEIFGNLLDVTVSIGIAYAAPRTSSAETLISRAEIALERARATGRGEWRIFKQANAVDPDTQRAMLGDLHRALETGEMTLGFQPVVSINDFRLTHADVRLRWLHSRIGAIESADFLPVLNDRAACDLLAAWTVRTVCEVAASARHELRLIVPLHTLSVPGEALRAAVEEALRETKLRPDLLMIGVPEPTLRNADPEMRATIDAMRALGVGIVLDDFAALPVDQATMRQMPVDAVRTSPILLEDLDNDLQAFVRFQGLTGLAHSLGWPVIGRGVRSNEEVEALRRFGFGSIEGPLLGGSLTAVELSAYARTGTPIARRPG